MKYCITISRHLRNCDSIELSIKSTRLLYNYFMNVLYMRQAKNKETLKK